MKLRLAQSVEDIRMAQRLRHDVFYDEGGARMAAESGLDTDKYDAACAHLLVVKEDSGGVSPYPLADGGLVATSRLIGQKEAEALGGFYSAGEFDLAPMLRRQSHLKFVELGRTCILKRARGTAVMELLWQGIWDFVRAHGYDVMIGCASFDGIDPLRHADGLAFLAKQAKAPEEWCVYPMPNDAHAFPLAINGANPRQTLAGLPPLIKGYLRLGCYIGEGCVIDRQFNTVDVLIILPVKAINPRYFAKFGAPR